MNFQQRLSLAALLPVVVVVAACDPPTHPKNYASTIINSLCHFQYDCCTPAERQLTFFIFGTDEASCVEEFNDQSGGFMAVQIEAIERGTATYDAEAADRCTKTIREGIDRCDSSVLVAPTGFSFQSLVFMVDEGDAECVALANRGFTRGTGKKGDECLSFVDCADFGNCVVEGDEDGEGLNVKGECEPLPAKGDDCADTFECQPGLVCEANADGAECVEPDLADDGDACVSNSSCASGFCKISDGACEGDGFFCEGNFDCDGACVDNACVGDGNFCDFDSDCDGVCLVAEPPVCAKVDVTIEICDGL